MRAITMIYIQGGTKRQRELAEDMTVFMFRKFNMYPDVEIAFKRLTNETTLGAVVEDEGEYFIELKRSLSQRNMLVTLAHELTHVKQYEYGELTQTSDVGIDYWERPSELEAHAIEDALFDEWARINELDNKKWAQYGSANTTV